MYYYASNLREGALACSHHGRLIYLHVPCSLSISLGCTRFRNDASIHRAYVNQVVWFLCERTHRLSVNTNLFCQTHQLLHRLKARMVVLIGDPIGAVSRVEIPAKDRDRMASAALGRAVWHATATYNEGWVKKVAQRMPNYERKYCLT